MKFADTRPLQDEILTKEEKAAYVKKCIEKLPASYKEALILREYENLSYEEIAQILHCSLNKVKILIYRARVRLRKEILPLIKEEDNV